jgi:hypothetical protein
MMHSAKVRPKRECYVLIFQKLIHNGLVTY